MILKSQQALLTLLLTILSLAILPQRLQAFPEMIRHGYNNCNTCHVSPAGGGILTAYGRELSKEVLSTWGTEREHSPVYGLTELPKNLWLGGDIRGIQTYRDTPNVREGRWFLMQADLEAAWTTAAYTAVASVGYDPGSPLTDEDNAWISRRHYVQVPLNETMSVRAGRFLRNYGLMIPDHSSQIRRGIGFDQGTETYNAEFNVITESYSLSFTGVGGRPDDEKVASEKGFVVTVSTFLQPSYRAGFSYFLGRTDANVGRELYGPYWALGLTEDLYWLGEVDWVRTAPRGSPIIEGWASYNRLGHQIVKGLDMYVLHQSRKNDRRKDTVDLQSYGAGAQWSPRPHWILSTQWEKQKRPVIAKKTIDSAWFIVQYAI
jgi:hypothetical protein